MSTVALLLTLLTEPFSVTVKVDTHLLKDASVLADKVAPVPAGSSVEILGGGSDIYFLARFGEHEGYVASATLDAPRGSESRTKLAALATEAKANSRRAKEEADRKDAGKHWANRVEREKGLLEKYGPKTGQQIIDGKAWIGMKAEQARESWGEPETINRTTTATGTREQWVYRNDNYLYLEDGKVTAIQN